MAIIYLHGFASSGRSAKVDELRKNFSDELVVSPDLAVEPKAAITQIIHLVQELYQQGETKFLFVGTSMGGFYSWYCSALFDAPAILVNPAIEPHITSTQFLGTNVNISTGVEFEWTEEYIQQLEDMYLWVVTAQKPSQLIYILAMDDDLIDSNRTIQQIKPTSILHTFSTGGHRFADFTKIMPIAKQAYLDIKNIMLDI